MLRDTYVVLADKRSRLDRADDEQHRREFAGHDFVTAFRVWKNLVRAGWRAAIFYYTAKGECQRPYASVDWPPVLMDREPV